MPAIPLSSGSLAALQAKGLAFVSCSRCGRRVRPKPGTSQPAGHVRPVEQQRNAWSQAVRIVCGVPEVNVGR